MRKNETGVVIDNLTYQYQKASNEQLIRNRLYHVQDAVTASAFGDDIDDMGAFTADANLINTDNNYSYDELGQLIKDEQENIQHINWRTDGKISSIIRGTGGTESSLLFTYNPMGQRLSKEIYDENDDWVETTYYIRDAQGNVMSTYLHKSEGASESFNLTERHIYGSSRLGLYKEPVSMLAVGGTGEFLFDIPGYRQYELSNHLGNVTTILTGQKVPIVSGSTLTGYAPQIVQSMDYSPFGVTRLSFDVTAMSTTHPVGDGYRYGWGGHEKTDELKGSGNHYTAEFWEYDPRTARRWNVDPVYKHHLSNYSVMSGNPISRIDPNGANDDWVEKADGSVEWDENVTSADDTDLQAGDKYLGKDGFGINDQTGQAIHYQSDGTKREFTQTIGEITATSDGVVYQSSNPSISSNNQTGFTYNDRDLAVRKSVLSTDNPIATAILRNEANGNYWILNAHDYWNYYGHTVGNLLLMQDYIDMALLVSGDPRSALSTPKSFSLSPTMGTPKISVPPSFKEYLRTQRGKDIGKYPGRGNWMKQKALEYNKLQNESGN